MSGCGAPPDFVAWRRVRRTGGLRDLQVGDGTHVYGCILLGEVLWAKRGICSAWGGCFLGCVRHDGGSLLCKRRGFPVGISLSVTPFTWFSQEALIPSEFDWWSFPWL